MTTRPKVVVRPSALALVPVVLIFGLLGYGMHVAAVSVGEVPLSAAGPVWLILTMGLGYLGIALAHEGGHVLAYLMLGMTWERLTIGPLLSVASPDARSNRAQLLISVAGPALHMLSGWACIVVAGAPWTPLWVLGALAAVDGACNLLLPFSSNFDSRKVFVTAWRTLRGQGSERFD